MTPLYVVGYVMIGLFTARRVWFAMDRHTDKANASIQEHNAKIRNELSNSYYRSDLLRSEMNVSKRFGNVVWLPTLSGVLWPLIPVLLGLFLIIVGVGKTLIFLSHAVAKSTGPVAKWFFTDPKKRKKLRKVAA
jgi:hypothetical protein